MRLEEAFLSAESIKRLGVSLHITLITDRMGHPLCKLGVFDAVNPIVAHTGGESEEIGGGLDWIRGLRATPYDRTLALDPMTRVSNPEIKACFSRLDMRDLALDTGDPGRTTLLYADCEAIRTWLDAWEAAMKQGQCEAPPPQASGVRVEGLTAAWSDKGQTVARSAHKYGVRYPSGEPASAKAELLTTAFRWVREGNDGGYALYDYVGTFEECVPSKSGWFGRAAAPAQREEWQQPVLKQADLHLRYDQRSAAAECLAAARENAGQHLLLAGEARLAFASGSAADAVEFARRAVALAPKSEYVALTHGDALLAAKRPVDAIAPLARAARCGRARASFLLGQAYFAIGNYKAAEAAYAKALRANPAHPGAENNLLPAMLGARNYRGALQHSSDMLERHGWHVPALAFRTVALSELKREREWRELVDLDGLVAVEDLAAPTGYRDIKAFNAAIARAVLADPSLAYEPQGHATRIGRHSGDLSNAQSPALRTLNDTIYAAAVAQMRAMPHETTTLYHRHIPKTHSLYSWAVVMNEGGHQVPHIHARAWMSGVYYVEVPSSICDTDPERSGWLEFGPAERRWYKSSPQLPTRQIRPRPGLLVTFPSYFWHSTRPLQRAERRISFAFDIVPAGV